LICGSKWRRRNEVGSVFCTEPCGFSIGIDPLGNSYLAGYTTSTNFPVLNALQANPSDPRIAVKSLTDTDGAGSRWVHIEVEDNGAGFTPEALKKVPEPFFTTRQRGTGLGLAIVRKRMHEAGGVAVLVPSANGKGARFELRLPLPRG